MAYATASSGASNQAAVWSAIRAVLLASGWTETTIVTTAGLRKSAFVGIAINQIAANAPVIVMGENVASNIVYFNTGSDWDPTAKSLINIAGDATINSGIATSATQNTWWIRSNGQAVFVCNLEGGFMYKAYAGWLHRNLSAGRDGLTTAVGGLSIGATTINTASSMVGKWQVGQKIQALDFAHVTGNANAANAELLTLSSVGASSVGVSALTKAYDAGALLGDRPMNVGVMGNCFVEWGNMYTPLYKNGGRSGATSQVAFYGTQIQGVSSMKPDTATGELPPGVIWHSWNSGSGANNGYVGSPMDVFCCFYNGQSYNDTYDDGLRQWNLIGVTTGVAVSVALT